MDACWKHLTKCEDLQVLHYFPIGSLSCLGGDALLNCAEVRIAVPALHCLHGSNLHLHFSLCGRVKPLMLLGLLTRA